MELAIGIFQQVRLYVDAKYMGDEKLIYLLSLCLFSCSSPNGKNKKINIADGIENLQPLYVLDLLMKFHIYLWRQLIVHSLEIDPTSGNSETHFLLLQKSNQL